jgi:hypothetical protein
MLVPIVKDTHLFSVKHMMFLVCFCCESCAPIRRASVQTNHLYQADAGKIIFPYFATPEGANLRKSYVRKSA